MAHRDADVAPAPASGGEAISSSKPVTTSKSSSSELDFPGAFPRDPQIALDHLSDQAGPGESAESATVLDAARGDVRRAVDAAASYLPESVVGAIGSVLPVGTTNTDEVDKKLDSSEASQMDLASKQTLGGLGASDIAVGGVATDLYPSMHNSPASPSAATGVPLPSSESSNTNFDAEAGANTPKGSFSKRLSNTYAPANIVSASSLDASSIPPDSMPPPEAENVEGKEKNIEEKPAFATYAPAPVITGSQSAFGASNTSPATQQFTAPSVAYALDSTTQKDVSLDTPAASPTPVPRLKPSDLKDKNKNVHPAFATYAPAPVITDSHISLDASGNTAPPESTESNAGAKDGDRVPASIDFASQPSLNTTQSLEGRTDAQKPVASASSTDSREKKAVEVAALGAGIGTLAGAVYVSSGSPAQAPFENSATANQTQLAASHVPSDTIAPAPAPRETIEENHSATAVGDKKNAQDAEKEVAASAAAVDKKAKKKAAKEAKHAEKEEKKAEKDAKKAEKKADKEQHKADKEAAATATAAEAADKKAQKEAKEREKEDKRGEKEAAAAALATDKETQKGAKERAEEAEKEAKNKEKEKELKTEKGSKKTEETTAILAATSAERQKTRPSQEDTVDSAVRHPAAESKSATQGSAAAPTAVSAPSSHNAPGTPPINPARPAPTVLGGSGSRRSYEPAKSGADSDFPLHSANSSVSGVHAIDLNGKGTGTSPSAAAGQTAPPAESDRSRYLGTEGLQEKFGGGALRSSIIHRKQGDGSSKFKEHNELDKDGDTGTEQSSEPKKESRVKHFMQKVKDRLHHHGN